MPRKTFLSAILAFAAAFVAAAANPALAAYEVNTSPGFTAAGVPLALHGFDPVAYFTQKAPTHGKADFTAKHEGAAYYFSTEENLRAFKANPSKYVPAYGGYCAYGVSVGKKFDGDPRFWKIVDGKLFLNLNAEIASAFEADVDGAVKKANTRWPKIKSKAPSSL